MSTTAPTNVSSSILEVRGGKIRTRVLSAGQGDPLLFLHGAGGLFWDPFLEALAGRFTVYAPEHVGSGDSVGLEELRDIWELVHYNDDLLDALGISKTNVVGHSFGGMVAAEFAANHRERINKLVLMAPIGLWRDDAPIADIAGTPPEKMRELVLADPTGPLAGMLTPPADDPEALFQAAMRMASVLHFIWPIPDKGLDRRIHRIDAPTLLVWGQQDKLVPPVYAQEFASRLQDAEVALIDGAGHLPQLEQPDATRSAVLDFLTR
jgi:pimeloyl-ACP methyl ester carboxylesterase